MLQKTLQKIEKGTQIQAAWNLWRKELFWNTVYLLDFMSGFFFFFFEICIKQYTNGIFHDNVPSDLPQNFLFYNLPYVLSQVS